MNTKNLRTMRSLFGWFVLAAVMLRPELLPGRTILEAGKKTVWKYLDTGVEPDAAWRRLGFDDAKWKSGQAPLGFGETAVTTEVNAGPDKTHRPITTWFRREFAAPELKPGEGLVVLCCIDDAYAIVYWNGEELGRVNMPEGVVRAQTAALKTIGNDEEGFYQRMHVPAKAVRSGEKNLLAVEVHQAGASSSDLFFDLALKVVPAGDAEAKASAAARTVIDQFNQRHFVGPGVTIPDGYIDGGRGMKVAAGGNAAAGREILEIDRLQDKELAADLTFARSAELKALPTLERVQRLAARIDQRTTPPGGYAR